MSRPLAPSLLIAILAMCGVVVTLSQSLVIPLVPQLPELLQTTVEDASWVLTSTLLAGAVSTPISGRLGDLYGKRRLMVVVLVATIAGSALCAVSSTLVPTVIGRVLQGMGISLVPLGISLMRDLLPAERLSTGVAVMSATLGVGGAIGMPIGALLVRWTNWHILFWAVGAAAAVALFLVLAFLPESAVVAHGRFDGVGAAGLAVGLTALLMVITKGNGWGWTSLITLGVLTTGILVLTGWGWQQLQQHSPIIDLRSSAGPPVLFTNLASIAVGFAMYASGLIFTQIVIAPRTTGYGLGGDLLQTALALTPNGVVMMLVSPLSARVTDRFGARTTLILGSAVLGLAYAGATVWRPSVWAVALISAVAGAGVGLAYSAMPALIMAAVPTSETAAANGLNSLMRSVGTSSSAAVLSVVMAATAIGGTPVPSTTGITTALWVSVGAAVLGALLATRVPK